MVVKTEKQKSTKKYVIKRKIKFENYKNCLEATQLDKKISYLEKNKIDIDSFFATIENIKNLLKK